LRVPLFRGTRFYNRGTVSRPVEELLVGHPVVITIPVAWGEMDAFQHVNNIVYFRYFESARIAYFEKMEMMEFMKNTGVGPILKSTECQYKFPLTYPDKVSVGARVSSIGEDNFVMEYCVVGHGPEKVVAKGSGVIVTYDYKAKQKTQLPLELKKRIEDLENS